MRNHRILHDKEPRHPPLPPPQSPIPYYKDEIQQILITFRHYEHEWTNLEGIISKTSTMLTQRDIKNVNEMKSINVCVDISIDIGWFVHCIALEEPK